MSANGRHCIAQFDAASPNDHIIQPGPNSLTVTCNGFSNLHHCDRDESPYNFGIFFAGDVRHRRFARSVHGGAGRVIGGEFWWPGYGVIAGVGKGQHYAEIIWRGREDYHGTLACSLAEGASWDEVNRWACSVQITRAYRQRVDKHMKDGSFPQSSIDI